MKDKLKNYLIEIICGGLCLVIIFSVLFFPKSEENETVSTRVVRIWNVDTFEGGKGSRTAYLKSAAHRVEKKREGVFFLISSYSPEGAEEAYREGNFPDALSFGIGLSGFAENAVELPNQFPGGQIGSKTYAYPWCRGGYALFSLSDQFDEPGATVISIGGRNLPQVAAFLENIEGDELPSLTAYTKFLNGEYRYLLGTQRDLCRFQSRKVDIYYRPLTAYCDLYQYYAILNPACREDALSLFEELKDSADHLESIGMYPLESESGFAEKSLRTIDVFSSGNALAEMIRLAGEKDEKKLQKYLKTI